MARLFEERRAAGALVLLLVMTACGDPPPETAEAPEIELIPLATIGGIGASGPSAFGSIVDLLIGPDGDVFVLDELNLVVQVFDQTGTHLRSIGRQGQGPGEIQGPIGLAWGPDDSIWVVDAANGRYTVFDRQGTLVATYPRTNQGFDGPWAGNISAEGILYDVAIEWEPGRLGSLDPDSYTSFIVASEIGDDELTELGRFEYPPSPDPVVFESGGLFGVAFTSEPFLRVGPAGWIWHADSGEPWVYRRGLTDDSARRFGRDLPSVPVTEADRAAVAAEPWLSRLRDAPPGVLAAYLRMIPDTKTHLQGFFFDDADRVWIVRTNPDLQSERLAVDVYDSSGEWVARAEVAAVLDPMPRVRGDLLAGVVRDELDVESIVLFRLR